MFVFLDESGDLGFDWSKKGTSRYFTVTVLICENKKAADGMRQAVKRTLKNKLNYKQSSRKHKELKSTNTTIGIKKYFYNQLPEDGWYIYSVTLNKERVTDHLKTKLGKKKLYNFLARFILEKTFISEVEGTIHFVVDKCKNKAEIKDFNQYIENQLSAISMLETKLDITHESSEHNLCLQAVDLFCGGIAKKYNGNKEWYECFRGKIMCDEMYFTKR